MSSHDHPQIEQKPALKEIRNITPQKEKRSTSVKDRLDNTSHKNENLPDIHMTPPTARTNTQSDEKQVKEAILAKIRSQNDLLRKQVKDLNSKLTGTSSTAKKTKTKSELEQNFSENLLRRQLQNAYKQIEQYKKQFQVFTDNPEGLDYFEKVKRMEDLLAEKDDKLEEMLTENRVLEKINREQDKELQSYRNTAGYEKKMNTYMEEVRCLKERINNMQAINRHNEHSFKKQQEHLVRMTRQYRMVCDKIGISPSTVFTRPEELDKMMAKKNIQVSRAQEDVIQDFEEAYMTKDNANASAVKVKQERSSSLVASRDGRSLYKRNSSIQNLKEYEQPRKSSEDSHKKDTEPLNSRMFILQSDKKETKKNDSGYEKSALTSRFNSEDNRKSIIRHRSLARINLAKNSESQQRISLTYSNIQHEESSFAPSKTDLETDVEQNKYIPTKPSENNSVKETASQELETPKKSLVVVRKSTGGRMESGLSEFNDKEYLPTPLSSKVTKLMVWSDENFVYGIQAFYQGEDTYYVAGEEHLGIEMKRKAKFVNSIEVEPDDHIEWISGKYEEGITYLKVKTGKGTVKEFGTKTESPNEFKIHVDPHENLTLLHGALYYKKGDENNEDVIILANIGFTLVKETKQ